MKNWGSIKQLKETLKDYDKFKSSYGEYSDQIEILIQADEDQVVLCDFQRNPMSPEDGITEPLLGSPFSHVFRIRQFEEIIDLALELTTGVIVVEDQTNFPIWEDRPRSLQTKRIH